MSGSSRNIGSKVVAVGAIIFLVAGCVEAGQLSSLISTSGASSFGPSTNPSAVPESSPDASPNVARTPAATSQGVSTASVTGHLTASPTCPVETVPPNPACAPKAMSGAIVVATDAGGHEVARAVSSADGSYSIALPPGTYTLTPQALADKMMRAPPAQSITIASGRVNQIIDFTYDTGIR